MLKINFVSIFVEDTDEALKFYTDILGFKKKTFLPEMNYITVVSPEYSNDVELLLEPNINPIAKTYQKSLYDQGIPSIQLGCDNIESEYIRLKKLGVKFKMEPKKVFGAIIAVFEDGCGNLLQIAEVINE